eukprot:gene17537-17813_t
MMRGFLNQKAVSAAWAGKGVDKMVACEDCDAAAAREAKREFDDPVFRLVVTVFNMVQCHREAFNEFVRRRYGERVRFRWLGTDRVTFNRF